MGFNNSTVSRSFLPWSRLTYFNPWGLIRSLSAPEVHRIKSNLCASPGIAHNKTNAK